MTDAIQPGDFPQEPSQESSGGTQAIPTEAPMSKGLSPEQLGVQEALLKAGLSETRAKALASQRIMNGVEWGRFELEHGDVALSTEAQLLKQAHKAADWATYEAAKFIQRAQGADHVSQAEQQKEVEQWKAEIAESYWEKVPK